MRRQARQSRPQLICVLADNSGSMAGPKAEAATQGIREMLLKCQSEGPRGPHRSYFRFILIRFGTQAEVDPVCNGVPVRTIDTDDIYIKGDGGGTNITHALELAYRGLDKYIRDVVEPHPERAQHPIPLVLVFSDGHNGHGNPEPIADKIKKLNVDGVPVLVACAGVSTNEDDQPDECLLRRIASPECYVRIDQAGRLSAFLAEIGNSHASTAPELVSAIQRLPYLRGIED